jgi:hypothetical protein
MGLSGLPWGYNSNPLLGTDQLSTQALLENFYGPSVMDAMRSDLTQSTLMFLLTEMGSQTNLRMPLLTTVMFATAEATFQAFSDLVTMTRLPFGVRSITFESIKILTRALVPTSDLVGGPVQPVTSERFTYETRKYAAAYTYHNTVLKDTYGQGPAIIKAMYATQVDAIRLCWAGIVIVTMLSGAARPNTMNNDQVRRSWRSVLEFYSTTAGIGRRDASGLSELRKIVNTEAKNRGVEVYSHAYISSSLLDQASHVLAKGPNMITGDIGSGIPSEDAIPAILSSLWGKKVHVVPDMPNGELFLDPFLRVICWLEIGRVPIRFIMRSVLRLLLDDPALTYAQMAGNMGVTQDQANALRGLILDNFRVSIVDRASGNRIFFTFRQLLQNETFNAVNDGEPAIVQGTNIVNRDVVLVGPNEMQGSSVVFANTGVLQLATTSLLRDAGFDPESKIVVDEIAIYAAASLINDKSILVVPPPLPFERMMGGRASFITTDDMNNVGWDLAFLPSQVGVFVIGVEIADEQLALDASMVPLSGRLAGNMNPDGRPLFLFGDNASANAIVARFPQLFQYEDETAMSFIETRFPAFGCASDLIVRSTAVPIATAEALLGAGALANAVAAQFSAVTDHMVQKCTSPVGDKVYEGCDQHFLGRGEPYQRPTSGPAIVGARQPIQPMIM